MIYFTNHKPDQYSCNMCQITIFVQEKGKTKEELFGHILLDHKEVIELHKGNTDDTVGFKIEFLQLNMLGEEIPKSSSTSTAQVIEEAISAKNITTIGEGESMQYILVDETTIKKVKTKVNRSKQPAKRSWVWKYFENLNNVIYRCNLCNVVLSIKGNNTNNMNRHVKSKHPVIYKAELMSASYTKKKDSQKLVTEVGSEVEIPVAVKSDDASATSTPKPKDTQVKLARRSWIWSYFRRITATVAECNLCNRRINHGGNATGNMHRHLKFLHNDVYLSSVTEGTKSDVEEVNWIWRLFSMEDKAYTCKICDFKCHRNLDLETNIQAILFHLRSEHEVMSGDQIISGPEFQTTEIEECNEAVDFLKGSEM